jgi:hypothetical protein
MSNQIEVRRPIPVAPVHPLAALAIIVLDNLFTIPEIAAPELWILTIPLIGVTGFVSTLFIQHYLAKDSWGESVAKGLVMGIIAGVPFSVTGTATGGVLLAWAGLHEWLKFPITKDQHQQLSSSDDEIVEAEVKEIKEEK